MVLVNPYLLQIIHALIWQFTVLGQSGLHQQGPLVQKVGSGIPQAVQWGHRNHQDRHHCCPGPEHQQMQRQLCHFTPDKTFCFHRSGTLNLVTVCKPPRSSAASSHSTKCKGPRELRHSPTSRLQSPYFPFTDASRKAPLSHSLLCFLGFFFSFCLTGGGCLSVARACMEGGSAKSSSCSLWNMQGHQSTLGTVFMSSQQNTEKHLGNSFLCLDELRACTLPGY